MKNTVRFLALALALAGTVASFSACGDTKDKPKDELESGFSYETEAESEKELKVGSTFSQNGIKFTLTSETEAAVSGYTGTSPAVVIPQKVNEFTVTEISASAFFENTVIASVEIPETVVKIGDDAFRRTSLSAVTGAMGVFDVGSYAFGETPLVTAASEEFTVIGNGILVAYSGAATSVTVPADVKVIAGAFASNQTLAAVTLPEGLVSISDNAFSQCKALTQVSIPATVTHIGDRSFAMCTALTAIVLPDSVTHVGENAFLCCISAKTLTLSKNLKTIGASAFQKCEALTNAVLPETVESIGECAFMNCKMLMSIYIPYNVTTIGELAFAKCNPALTVQCTEGSPADAYCKANSIAVKY